MKEYKVWAFARSAAPNLPALEEQLADVMREADRRGYIIVNSCIVSKIILHLDTHIDIKLRNGQTL